MKPQETNPHKLWTPEWYAWKERRGYLPYHVGSRPDGTPCTTMPRVVLIRPGVYRCPDCGKEFPTATAEIEAQKKETGS